MEPGDEKRTFYNLSVPKKLVVMLGGPTMNPLIALVLFTVVFAGFGTPTPSTTVSTVTACVPDRRHPEGTCVTGSGTPPVPLRPGCNRRPDRGLGCGARVRLAHPQPGHP